MQEIKDKRYNVETFGNEDARNNTPFDFSLSQENNNLAKALIFMGADKEKALIRSAIRGNLELVQFLLDHGADISAKNKEGSTALINAVFVQDSEVVKELLDKKADPNVKNNNGRTALTYASFHNNQEFIQLLITMGADINAHDKNNKTAIMIATGEKQNALLQSPTKNVEQPVIVEGINNMSNGVGNF